MFFLNIFVVWYIFRFRGKKYFKYFRCSLCHKGGHLHNFQFLFRFLVTHLWEVVFMVLFLTTTVCCWKFVLLIFICKNFILSWFFPDLLWANFQCCTPFLFLAFSGVKFKAHSVECVGVHLCHFTFYDVHFMFYTVN